jgi:Rrf2 family protein
MRFSAKVEYGILAILALCLHSGPEPLQVKSIAQKQKIPIRFLEQVMNLLKKQGLVESVRGRQGGYLLTKTPDQIRFGEVLQAIEGPLAMIDMTGRETGSTSSGGEGIENTVIQEVWTEANASLEKLLNSITFQDLCERKKELEGKQVLMFHI